MIEPYACSVHAVKCGRSSSRTWSFSRRGPLGLGMVGAARLKNPSKLVVLDTKPERLEIAKRCGADLVMNPLEEDVVKIVKEMTGGYGCDVYIEATGHPSSVTQGLQMIRKRGRFVEFSVFGEEVTVDWSMISDRKELDLDGSHLAVLLSVHHLGDRRRSSADRGSGHAPNAAGRLSEGIDMTHKERVDQNSPGPVRSGASLPRRLGHGSRAIFTHKGEGGRHPDFGGGGWALVDRRLGSGSVARRGRELTRMTNQSSVQ